MTPQIKPGPTRRFQEIRSCNTRNTRNSFNFTDGGEWRLVYRKYDFAILVILVIPVILPPVTGGETTGGENHSSHFSFWILLTCECVALYKSFEKVDPRWRQVTILSHGNKDIYTHFPQYSRWRTNIYTRIHNVHYHSWWSDIHILCQRSPRCDCWWVESLWFLQKIRLPDPSWNLYQNPGV